MPIVAAVKLLPFGAGTAAPRFTRLALRGAPSAPGVTAADITGTALAAPDGPEADTVRHSWRLVARFAGDHYWRLVARFAGDVAITLKATGG